MTQVISELRKVATTRTWWLVLLGMVAYSACFTAFIVFAATMAPQSPLELGSAEAIVISYNLAVAVAYVFPLAMGVVVVTQEYRSKLIGQTLLATPSRPAVYGAKIAAGLAVGVLYAVVSVLVCVGVAAGMLAAQGEPTFLTSATVMSAVVGSVAVLALWGVIGVGVGALVRNQVIAIVGIVALTQFVEPTVRMAGTGLAGEEITWLLPSGAGDAAAGGTMYSTVSGVAVDAQWPGFLMLGVYALVFCALGAWRFARYEMA